MAARLRPHSGGIRALLSAARRRKPTAVDCGIADAAIVGTVCPVRRCMSTGAIGKCSQEAISATPTGGPRQDVGDLSCQTFCGDASPAFPLCSRPVQRFLDEAFAAACDLVPPSLVSELRVCGQRLSAVAFVELASACQECLGLDATSRHQTVCAYSSRWTHAAQTALASVLAHPTLPRGVECRTEHSAEFVIFVLQLKLQAAKRLMDDDYIARLQGESLKKEGVQGNSTTAVLRDTATAMQDKSMRAVLHDTGTAIQSGLHQRVDEIESSAVLNATIWRQASKHSERLDDCQPGEPDATARLKRKTSIPLRMADRVRAQSKTSATTAGSEENGGDIDTPALSSTSVSTTSLEMQCMSNASGSCAGIATTGSACFGRF